MTVKQQKEYKEKYIIYVLEKLNIKKEDYKYFVTIGNKLHHLYELNCNGYISSEPIYRDNEMINRFTDEMYEAQIKPLYKKAERRAKERGLFIYFQTDPRGATIYLSKEPIADNNYNRQGCECIY